MGTSWHALTADETLRRLGSDRSGLSSDEAAARLGRFGLNRLDRIEPVPALRILADQFSSLVVLLLVAAALVALLVGDVFESLAIGAVLALNATLGFAVELRARRAMDALLRYEVTIAKVLREGRPELVGADRLVPGDVVLIEEGDVVPADARLITATALQTDEAALTGESHPVDKDPEALPDPTVILAERTPMLYSGTPVTRGRGLAVLTATGSATELGRIGKLIAEVEEPRTPLEIRLDALGRRLVGLTLGIATVVAAAGSLRGQPIGLMIETGIALAIAAVPEGLPAIATIALAVGLRRMARRNALVRRLVAVEALGAATVVCTDKTGTLTSGQMTVVAIASVDRTLTVTGRGFSPVGDFRERDEAVDPSSDPWIRRLLGASALTSRATVRWGGSGSVGDPTDVALSVLALKGGIDLDGLRKELPQEAEIPFSSRLRASASIHRRGPQRVILVKGSPSTVLERSVRWASPDGDRVLDAEAAERLRRQNDALAEEGLRVIALAEGPGTEPAGLTFLGLVGIVDPPADGVAETIGTLRRAGIRTVMLTGDQGATATAIARRLGTVGAGERALGGDEVGRMSDEELMDRVGGVAVLSRLSPEDKVRIVSAFQRRGDVVAMIGDGVNDAAALRKADIGVAMGERGTDIAKQTAAIVLMDDRFPTIGAAVEGGRVIFENIHKFVFYLFSCNLAEILVLLVASLAGAPLPLLPLQILWLNLVTDTFPALALALEVAEPDIMSRPPRDPRKAILTRRFLRSMGFYAILIAGVTLGAHAWALRSGTPEQASTVAFMTLALAQLFHLGNARSRGPVMVPVRMFANPWAVGAVPLVLALQLLAVYWAPISSVLGTVPLQPADWLVIGGLSIVPAVVGQIIAASRSGHRTGPKP